MDGHLDFHVVPKLWNVHRSHIRLIRDGRWGGVAINSSSLRSYLTLYLVPVIRYPRTLRINKLLPVGVQELCETESRGGRPGLSVYKPYGFCGRKGTLTRASALVTVCP